VHAAKNIAPGPSRVLATVILEKGQPPSSRRSRAPLPGTLPYRLDSGCAQHFRIFFELAWTNSPNSEVRSDGL